MKDFDPAGPLDAENQVAAIETAAHGHRLEPLRHWIKPRIAAEGVRAAPQSGGEAAGSGNLSLPM